MSNVEWREVPGTDGAYSASADGRVRRNHRVVIMKNGIHKTLYEKELRPCKAGAGYLAVRLCGNKHGYVHRMVASAFLECTGKDYEVNHKDENKSNNHVSNLEWVTHRQNCNYGTRNERCGDPSCQVVAKYGNKVAYRFPSINAAGRSGFARTMVRECCNGKRAQYRGLTWSREV